MSEDAVKVAVRVRPFLPRELDRNAELIIDMVDKMTIIRNPEDESDKKTFTFDYSYWSHDNYTVAPNGVFEANNARYASQQRVFDDLGKGMLDNAFQGYNCSLFAYGQTGAGKSYSIVGFGPNKGIVPIICEELFQMVSASTEETKSFITYSMLEIYNEQVRDLLNRDSPKGGLAVRQNPGSGFYVQGLKHIPVGTYKDIEIRMKQGTSNRTIAATNMNATSSRAHTVVSITFDQIKNNLKKSSIINLVDLAGSERVESTGATGDRLKEGARINQSLSALGNVIAALVEVSTGTKKAIVIPYRNSTLTKLLQNALGGNSKTVMIAALSPADINYGETLSTLRFADRAKQIKNKAIINENPMEKLIRELREENERLKKAFSGEQLSEMNTKGMTKEEIKRMRKDIEDEIRAQLLANMEMIELQDRWEEKVKAAQDESNIESMENTRQRDYMLNKVPHLRNLNEDPMLSGVIVHFLEADKVTIGREEEDHDPPTICLKGLSISKNHAIITRKDKNHFQISYGVRGAKTKINGLPLVDVIDLRHKDRIKLGSNHLYVFWNPLNVECDSSLPDVIDWDFAQREIAQAKGFATELIAGLTKEQQLTQERILEILPMVSEVNAICEEIDKQCTFEVILISPAAQDCTYGSVQSTKVMVKMKNLLNDNTWLWERGKFMNRRYVIQEMYQSFLEGEDVSKIPKEKDPFWEPAEDVMIGTANVYLQSLGFCLDFDDRLVITDYKGGEEGFLYASVKPCSQRGRALEEDGFVDDPLELLNKPFYFKVTIRSVEVQKVRYSRGIKVQYRVFKDDTMEETPCIKGTLEAEFNHTKMFAFQRVTMDLLDYFEHGHITFLVYGIQEDGVPLDINIRSMDSKDATQLKLRTLSDSEDGPLSEMGPSKSEHSLIERKLAHMEHRELALKKLCDDMECSKMQMADYEHFYRAVFTLVRTSGTPRSLHRNLQNGGPSMHTREAITAPSKTCHIM